MQRLIPKEKKRLALSRCKEERPQSVLSFNNTIVAAGKPDSEPIAGISGKE
jgi:hypothetical protein